MRHALVAVLVAVAGFLVPEARAQEVLLKAAYIPIAHNVGKFAAVDLGYFKEEGLRLEMIPVFGGAKMMEALAGGDVVIGQSNIYSDIMAKSRGLDIRWVTGGAYVASSPPDPDAIMVLASSAIHTAKDLEGKRFGVNTLNGIAWIFSREFLQKQGAQPSRVTFLEMGFPQMPSMLLNGQVDAVSITEPFRTRLLDSGKVRVLGAHFYEVRPGGVISAEIGRAPWIDRNQGIVDKFVRAYNRGLDAALNDKALKVRLLQKWAKIDPDIAEKMAMPGFRKQMPLDEVNFAADLLLKHRLIERKPDLQGMIHRTAR